VAEVYPTSDCRPQLGASRAYAVNTESAEVLKVFGQKQTDAIEKNCYETGNLPLDIIKKASGKKRETE
jgi:hypothetical protein